MISIAKHLNRPRRWAASLLALAAWNPGITSADTIIGATVGGDTVVLKAMDFPSLGNEKPVAVIPYDPEKSRPVGFFKSSDGNIFLNETEIGAANSRIIDIGSLSNPKLGAATNEIPVGLKLNKTLAGAVSDGNGGYLAIASVNGIGSYSVINFDSTKGEGTDTKGYKLKAGRVANLTQCPDGEVYATTMSKEGGVSLVKLDQAKKAMVPLVALTFDDIALRSDLKALVCAPGPRFYGLADPLYSGSNALFGLNTSTGAMNFIKFTKLDWMMWYE